MPQMFGKESMTGDWLSGVFLALMIFLMVHQCHEQNRSNKPECVYFDGELKVTIEASPKECARINKARQPHDDGNETANRQLIARTNGEKVAIFCRR